MLKSKAESYIGFCIKAGKLTCGFNAIEEQKKDIYLLLLCDTASENAKKKRFKTQRTISLRTAAVLRQDIGRNYRKI